MTMKKITALSPEQIALMPVYRDRWTAIGLSTDPSDRRRAEHGIRLAYQMGGRVPPQCIVWCQSPMSQALTRALIVGKFGGASVGGAVGASVRTSVRTSAVALVEDSVEDSPMASAGDAIWASVEDSVRAVWALVWDAVKASVEASVWDSGYGQHDAPWLAFYQYFCEVCHLVQETQALCGLWEIAQSAGWWLPHERLCWVSERPCHLARDEEGRLHDEHDMAIRYQDGWGIYALHGVRVSASLVTTPADALDPHCLLTEPNAEVRREIVRKIGIERVCRDLGARTLDRGTDDAGQPCELLSLDLGDGRYRPFIKLRNPSIGVYHLEGIHPDCRTVEQALRWRNGTDTRPSVLT